MRQDPEVLWDEARERARDEVKAEGLHGEQAMERYYELCEKIYDELLQ